MEVTGNISLEAPPSSLSGRREAGSHGQRKVFYLVDSFDIGGTESQAVELALRMPAQGYEVTLGVLRAEGPLLQKLKGSPVAVEEFRPRGGIDSPHGLYQMARLAWFLRRGRFDVVHAHDLWSNLMGVPAARVAGIPAIISSQRDLSHLAWYQGRRRAWLRRVQRLSHAVLANAAQVRDAMIVEKCIASDHIKVICNGVDVGKFNRSSSRSRLFPGLQDRKLIVLVGNMYTDGKGHPWLIESAPDLLREFPLAHFVLVGDGKCRQQFEQKVETMALNEHFSFLGRRDDVDDILASCDFGVLPSLAEGLPNSVLEYMAAGLPVVVTRVGGCPDAVEDGVTGWVVPPRDAKALSSAFLRYFREPAEARRFAENGREFVRRNFSFERLVREVDALYSELLSANRGRG